MTALHDQIKLEQFAGLRVAQLAPVTGMVTISSAAYIDLYKGSKSAAQLALASDARIAELEAEGLEQARIIGIGAERELALMARVSELEAWIRRDGCISDTCTKSILGSVCDGCRCKNAK